ncbi:MAG TPA: hypothetical protein VKJ07_00700, partial [Mycobacteriales bacterium]|nr:hypothetical protein [Mycobacteriales bacterium]
MDDPVTLHTDNSTLVLEGDAATGIVDYYALRLAIAPSGPVTIAINPADSRVSLSSTDPFNPGSNRFHTVTAAFGNTAGVYYVTFDATNWNIPVLIKVGAVDDFVREDPHDTLIVHAVAAGSASEYVARAVKQRLDVRVLDNETAGVVVTESGGKTLVTFGDSQTHTPGPGDSYTIRLTSAPTANVKVAIVTDGQADVVPGGSVAMEAVGGATPLRLFNGGITITGATVTRAGGPESGSFIGEGFAAGQLIRIGGTGTASDGDYHIASVATDGQSMTLTAAPSVPGTYTAFLSRVVNRGLYTGSVAYDSARGTLTRTDGTSWLDDGVALPGVTDYFRHIVVNGVPTDVKQRAIVLVFTPDNWMTPQTVDVGAVNDARAEGDRVVVTSHSVISSDPYFNGAVVR